MTPQGKAKELYIKYNDMDFHDLADHHESAKQCALIAVDEVFCVYKSLFKDDDIIFSKETDYWQQVKEEIMNYKEDNFDEMYQKLNK